MAAVGGEGAAGWIWYTGFLVGSLGLEGGGGGRGGRMVQELWKALRDGKKIVLSTGDGQDWRCAAVKMLAAGHCV